MKDRILQQDPNLPAVDFSPAARNYFSAVSSEYFDRYFEESPGGYAFRVRKQLLLSLLNPNGGALLDVGCGPGVMVDDTVQRGYSFWGVDVSHEMIAECVGRFGHLSGTHFRQGSATSLLFPDATFDVVICMGVIDHVPRWEMAVAEMIRVAKPNGDILVAFPNLYSPWASWRNFVFYRTVNIIRPYYLRLTRRSNRPALNTNGRMFRPGEVARLAVRLQAEVVGVHFFNFNVMLSPLDEIFPRSTMWIAGRLEALHAGVLRWLGGAFLVHLKKSESGVAP